MCARARVNIQLPPHRVLSWGARLSSRLRLKEDLEGDAGKGPECSYWGAPLCTPLGPAARRPGRTDGLADVFTAVLEDVGEWDFGNLGS